MEPVLGSKPRQSADAKRDDSLTTRVLSRSGKQLNGFRKSLPRQRLHEVSSCPFKDRPAIDSFHPMELISHSHVSRSLVGVTPTEEGVYVRGYSLSTPSKRFFCAVPKLPGKRVFRGSGHVRRLPIESHRRQFFGGRLPAFERGCRDGPA
jgi:hypothetical protein